MIYLFWIPFIGVYVALTMSFGADEKHFNFLKYPILKWVYLVWQLSTTVTAIILIKHLTQ